ncbi:MAG: histone deacetylase [Pirellulales bacterium]|nr:histone deacetylase [Pirellulales bacterium]
MAVGWIYDRRFLDHQTEDVHLERPERLEVIVETLREAGLLQRMRPIAFRLATPEQLAMVHEPAYVDVVRMMCDEGFTAIGTPDTQVCPRSYDAAALAAGGVIAACDAVMAGEVRRAFCAVRPPGHHAERDLAMGFCLFNNVALGAEHLIRRHGLSRVAIVDFDVHHGNGTQHAFESRRDVFYISLHERPGSLPFPGSGEVEEEGVGPGRGFTLNVPLSFGSGEAEYLAAIRDQVLPTLDRFGPEFLLLSAGFDALGSDMIAHVALDPRSYGLITEALVAAAETHAHGRLVSVLEGGYDLCNLGRAVVAHVAALAAGAD